MSFTVGSTRICTTSILLIFIAEAAAAAGSADGMANSPPDPKLVLSQHFAVQSADQVWSAETVEIEAAIPKLAQHRRLRAIRRLLPIG